MRIDELESSRVSKSRHKWFLRVATRFGTTAAFLVNAKLRYRKSWQKLKEDSLVRKRDRDDG